MNSIERQIAERLQPILLDLERDNMRRESERAKEDPKKHRLTRVFEKPLSYSYYPGKRGAMYCYTHHRNVAGYFLIWRQRTNRRGVTTRDQHEATKDKRDAMTTCRLRAGL